MSRTFLLCYGRVKCGEHCNIVATKVYEFRTIKGEGGWHDYSVTMYFTTNTAPFYMPFGDVSTPLVDLYSAFRQAHAEFNARAPHESDKMAFKTFKKKMFADELVYHSSPLDMHSYTPALSRRLAVPIGVFANYDHTSNEVVLAMTTFDGPKFDTRMEEMLAQDFAAGWMPKSSVKLGESPGLTSSSLVCMWNRQYFNE